MLQTLHNDGEPASYRDRSHGLLIMYPELKKVTVILPGNENPKKLGSTISIP